MKLRKPLTATGLGLVTVGAVLLFQLTGPAAAALRAPPSWDDGRVTVQSLCLYGLADGGARARVDATARLADGGCCGPENTQFFDLVGAPRTNALNAIDNAKTAWVNAQP